VHALIPDRQTAPFDLIEHADQARHPRSLIANDILAESDCRNVRFAACVLRAFHVIPPAFSLQSIVSNPPQNKFPLPLKSIRGDGDFLCENHLLSL
jgi:hypothetical protein